MKHFERDYFISRIRSGIHFLNFKDVKLKILTPTPYEYYEATEIYNETYLEASSDGIKTHEEMEAWMVKSGLWTDEDEKKEEGFNKDIETLKMEIFKHRNQEAAREKIRQYLRSAEQQGTEHSNKKLKFYDNTCEGIAFLEKFLFLTRVTTFNGSYPYDFSRHSAKDVWMSYQNSLCSEKTMRELARTDPWTTAWNLKDVPSVKLFYNKEDRELSLDQRNLLIWSRMYDNINESLETPSKDVIDDDDLLDGWLIIQHKEREAERAKSELENTMNDKVRNSDEIFMMAGSNRDANRIDSMNSIGGKMVKKEREAAIKRAGKLDQQNLPDQKILIQNQVNQQYKDKFGR